MKTIYLEANSVIEEKDLVLCLGFFDGLHIAHQELVRQTLKISKERNLKSGMMTFSDHILSTLKGERFYYLSSLQDKIDYASEVGFDYLYVLVVSKELISIPPLDFINRFLCVQSVIVVGFDFTYGQFGKGDTTLLKKQDCFKTVIVSKMIFHQEKIGSTKIRDLLIQGNLDEANELLGKPYSIKGEVIKGKSRGKELGFPTANILNQGYLSARSGVYVGKIVIDQEVFYGLINIGNNPTFEDAFESIEAYIFDFSGSIYGKVIEISFLHYIREEIKFNVINDLIQKMVEDELIGRKFLKEGGYL